MPLEEIWIIDGYNLLHGLSSRNCPLQIPELFRLAADYASLSRNKTIMILDGIGSEAELGAFKTAYFDIHYSGEISADTYIERLVTLQKEKARLVVVTRDRAIANIVRGAGHRSLNIEDYKLLIQDHVKGVKKLILDQKADSHGFNRPFFDKLKNHKS